MIFDGQLKFSDEQAITADAISENVYDRGSATADAVAGEDLYLIVFITETFNNLTSLDITLESSAAAALTSPTAHATKNVTLASGGLAAGQKHVIGKLGGAGDLSSLQYLGVDYNVNGTNPGTGSVSAFLTDTPPQNPPA